MQDLYAEFNTVVQAFSAEGIPYAVCGGLAFAIHVHPRATVDMDFLILKRLRGSKQDIADIEGLTKRGEGE